MLIRGSANVEVASSLWFRPTFVQQTIRTLLHMATFAVAYVIMLLAMYYNEYIIICIFIGAFLDAFAFTWESVIVAVRLVFLPSPRGDLSL